MLYILTIFLKIYKLLRNITMYKEDTNESINQIIPNLKTGENEYESVLAPNINWTTNRNVPITVFGLPYEIDDDVLADKMEKYGTVTAVIRQGFKLFSTINSGVSVVKLNKIIKPIPTHLYLKGHLNSKTTANFKTLKQSNLLQIF